MSGRIGPAKRGHAEPARPHRKETTMTDLARNLPALGRARPARRLVRIARGARNVLAALGLLLGAGFVAGLAADLGSFDQTRGGYEPPYEGWTGTPIDWSRVDVTPTGMARRGRVTNSLIDCTTGMITIEVAGLQIPFRGLSDRALAVHKPREACIDKGFSPAF
jgi:hypothetical protein